MTSDQERTIDALCLIAGGSVEVEDASGEDWPERWGCVYRVKSPGQFSVNWLVFEDGSCSGHRPWDEIYKMTAEEVMEMVYELPWEGTT